MNGPLGGQLGLEAALHEAEIPSPNGLRAIAVSAVLILHGGVEWFPGGAGVTLFFVLSGFLITWLLIQERKKTGAISLSKFYARRSLRIFPAFYVYCALVIGMLLLSDRTVELGHVVSTLTYTGNYWIAIGGSQNESLSHAWSLAIEEQYYLVWPSVFVLLGADRRKIARALALLIGVIWANRVVQVAVLGQSEAYLYHATDTRIDHLLIGCCVAIAVPDGAPSRLVRFLSTGWLLAACTLLAASLVASHASPIAYRMTVGFAIEPCLMALIIAQCISLRPRVLNARPLRFVGRISYGMYLYQQIAMPLASRLIPAEGAVLTLAAGYALTLIAAWGSFRLIEAPMLGLKARFNAVPTIP